MTEESPYTANDTDAIMSPQPLLNRKVYHKKLCNRAYFFMFVEVHLSGQ